MTLLVYFAHANPTVRARYERAAKTTDVEMDLVFVNRGGYGSKVYRQLAAELQDGDGRHLPGLLRRHPPPRAFGAYDGVVLASFSAGYGLSTSILSSPADAAEIAGVVSIDSWHAGFDADGTASDADLAPLLAYAIRAIEGPTVCWLGYTDVPTPQSGSGAFASTAQVAAEVRRLIGASEPEVSYATGGFATRPYNLAVSAVTEHKLALTKWGPGFLAGALQQIAERRRALGVSAPDSEPTLPQAPLGLRAFQIAREEQLAGIRELPGHKHSKRIQQYFDGCRRNGVLIRGHVISDETPWCAAGLGWCLAQAAVPGEDLPHKRRLSVREIWADAIASGAARSAEAVRRGDYRLQVGDAWIGVRSGYTAGAESNPFGPSQGRGHTGRVAEIFDVERFRTLDANINDTWTDVDRVLSAPELVGLVAHPPAPSDGEPELWTPTAEDVAILRRLWELSDAASAGLDGMDALGPVTW